MWIYVNLRVYKTIGKRYHHHLSVEFWIGNVIMNKFVLSVFVVLAIGMAELPSTFGCHPLSPTTTTSTTSPETPIEKGNGGGYRGYINTLPGLELELSEKNFPSKVINGIMHGRCVSTKWAQFWNIRLRSWRENRQNRHRKSPKSPFGGILPKPLIECCRGSNSLWKTGITSFIWLTQSKLRSVLRKWESWKTQDFELVHLRTGSTKWSLRYQFSTQNLTLYNIQLMALVKFRQMAILAIFGGIFGDFLARILIECFKIGLIL